jgi:DNA repair exonuclease SbcCD ATPase subunit
LQAEIEVLLADKDLISEVSELSLVRQGRSLVKPFTNECPLCKSPFAQGELESKLEEREQRLSQVDERTDSVNEMAQEIHTMLEEVRAELNHLIETLRESAVDAQLRPLASYHYQLDELQSDLQTDIVDNIKSVDESTFDVDLYDEEAESVITELADIAANRPERSQLEAQWDALKSATDNYELWIDAKTRLAAAEDAYSEFDTAYDEFIAARDEILSEVYEEISDLFITFYTTINPDESDIDSILSPTNTGIQFNIEFDGEGDHPPHALHSEGHQDSMGVCLFLALADHFSPLKRMPLLLDDVVMSIDETHRQRVAEMFENELPDRFQLFMTTHDRDWARQLVDTGVVDENNVVNFDDRELNDASGIPATND